MLKYLILFLIALVSSLFLTPVVRSAARKFGALDLPGGRKVHDQPIPRLGGISIFVTFNLILLVAYQFNFFYFPNNFLGVINYGWLLVASDIVLGVGVVDDLRRIPPSIKFFFQIIAGLIIALTCCKIEGISLPFGSIYLGIWSIPVTVIWVVAITNAINLLDGLDGLAAGTSFIVCLATFGISLFNQNIGISLVSVILAGSILGFLRYNFHPASIFLGDSGAYFVGFILSVLPLLGSLKGTTTIAILIPILALGLPIMDTVLSMFRRLLKSLHIVDVDRDKNIIKFFFLGGWSMFKADKDHIHHRLLQMGFTQRKAVSFLYIVSLMLGGLAFSSVYFKNINYALFLGTIGIASYIGIRRLGYTEIQFLRNGTLLPLFDVPGFNFKILRIFVDMAFIALCYYLALLLRFEGEFTASIKEYYLKTIPLVLSVKLGIFYFSSLYKGAWRYTGVSDLIKILKAVVFGCAASALLLWVIPGYGVISRAVIIIDFNLLFFFLIGERSSFRILEHLYLSKNHNGRKILIYGVGRGSVHALNEFINNPRLDLSPIGFIDDDRRNQGKQVNGYPVLGSLDSLETILSKNSISEIVVTGDDILEGELERLSKVCNTYQISLRRFQTRLEEISVNGQNHYARK
jgi:UDP-GlcNAc:undecaprenyl-phosphate GlcNAc-1-phosphate transferase